MLKEKYGLELLITNCVIIITDSIYKNKQNNEIEALNYLDLLFD